MILEVSNEERDQLVRLIEKELEETRSEFRRTDSSEWRDSLEEETDILNSLYKRLKTLDEIVVP